MRDARPDDLPTGDVDVQRRVVAFVRAFGLHRPEQTPCGAPVAVSEAHALAVLDDHGSLAQGELAVELELAKSTVSRLVDQLEQRGWAERHPSVHDARCRLVALTGPGRRVADQVALRRRERLARLLEHVPAPDRTGVLAALDLLVEAARDSREPSHAPDDPGGAGRDRAARPDRDRVR